MKITVHSSKLVKPAYSDSSSPFAKAEVVPLSVFDKATFDQHIPALYFFPAPAPPRAALEAGLATALAHYREWAGRRGADAEGNPTAILLTDAGARLVEATADSAIAAAPVDDVGLLAPETLMSLHPSCNCNKEEEELVMVQVTRFACGAFVVGVSSLHLVADGHAVFEFLAAWGQATRGVAVDPVPFHDRVAPFTPRHPPRVEFDHREAEFKVAPRPSSVEKNACQNDDDVHDNLFDDDEVVVSTVRFTREWISNLKSHIRSSSTTTTRSSSRTSTLQCVLAHLWRCITAARGLIGHQTTTLRIAVNGRTRMRNPEVPAGYTGNVVLWARPTTTVHDLTTTPLASTVELIARAVAEIDDRYFRSFIDFASNEEAVAGLAPVADAAEAALSPDVEVDSLLGLPAHRVDFGSGPPSLFVPGYIPVEGVVFVVPSFDGDGSVYAYVPLFRRAVDAFNNCCYVLPDEPHHAALFPTAACADDLPRVMMTATRMCGAPPPRV
ncbi:hypothetical protein PR202_gb13590 [Eleusine coracana subsp. coracana]|uniref:Uncharacterized protein n=1 Tax=Eleusine coracana subsp. coracana TaxID=191504 RepID=A0AAV5EU49_ELECO|nr:hypothetical protein PR202_gb13590 [Eleusine coracana subsp. coracana]